MLILSTFDPVDAEESTPAIYWGETPAELIGRYWEFQKELSEIFGGGLPTRPQDLAGLQELVFWYGFQFTLIDTNRPIAGE